ncbi:MAG: hypothetical protein ACAI44_26570 [Candidatus Sericytochromatia bacterium]
MLKLLSFALAAAFLTACGVSPVAQSTPVSKATLSAPVPENGDFKIKLRGGGGG